MALTGSPDTRLIIVRGNSASGKSTLARALRAARPRGIAILGHDQLRREILHVPEEPGNPSVNYLDLSARYALDLGLDVLVEGILYSHTYGAMLTELLKDHRGISRCYRYELSFDETTRRHGRKPQAAEYGPSTMREWWLDADPIPEAAEHAFGADMSLDDAMTEVLRDCGWTSSAGPAIS